MQKLLRFLFVSVFICVQQNLLLADSNSFQNQRAPVSRPQVNSSSILSKWDPEDPLAKRINLERPIRQGSLNDFKNITFKINDTSSVSLGRISEKAFVEQDQIKSVLQSIRSPGVLAQAPEFKTEVLEFKDAFAVTKSTTLVVSNPEVLSRSSPLLKGFGGRKLKPNQRLLPSLNQQKLQGFRQYLQNDVPKLSPNDPIRLAAQQGEEAVLKAIAEGKGQYEITDTFIIPKNPFPVVNGKMVFPFRTTYLNQMDSEGNDRGLDQRVGQNQVTQRETRPVEKPSVKTSGEADFHTEFLAGFTKGNAWHWRRRWDYPSGFFRISLAASYGVGCRIPIQVDGKVSPTNILIKDVEDKPAEFKTDIKVQTLDADASFYRRAGLPQNLIFDGKEAVLEASFGFGMKLRALWTDILPIPYTEIGIPSQSQSFKPPLGNENVGPVIAVPPEVTQTVFNFAALKGFAQFGVRLKGDGKVSLEYQPALGEQKLEKKELTFRSTVSVPEKRELPGVRSNQAAFHNNFGFTLSNPKYKVDLSLVPVVQIDADIGVDWLSKHFTTGWIDLNAFTLHLGSLSFGRHSGTRKEFKYAGGKKEFKKIGDWQGEVKNGDIVGLQHVRSGKFVRAGLDIMECHLGAVSPHARLWEAFRYEDMGNGKIALRCIKNGLYVRGGVHGQESRLGALSPHKQSWETFKMVSMGTGKFALQAVNSSKYVSVGNDGILRASSSRAAEAETFKFWPVPEAVRELPVTESKDKIVALQSVKSGKYVRAGIGDRSQMGANDSNITQWGAFKLKDLGNRKVALQCMKSGKYVQVTYNLPHLDLMALGANVGKRETFGMRHAGEGKVAFHSEEVGRFVRVGIGNQSLLGASTNSIGEWETFRLVPIPQAATTTQSYWTRSQS
jgi:hypothetical protein